MDVDLGLLIFKTSDGRLAFKRGDNRLAYKSKAPGETTVSFSWSSEGNDLDICAFWFDEDSMKVGYKYQGAGEHVQNSYKIIYSGDDVSPSGTEWVTISKKGWGAEHKFRVHFNFYGYSSDYPSNQCSVIATQVEGEFIVKESQNCGTDNGSKATTSHPYCDIVFNSAGKLIRID